MSDVSHKNMHSTALNFEHFFFLICPFYWTFAITIISLLITKYIHFWQALEKNVEKWLCDHNFGLNKKYSQYPPYYAKQNYKFSMFQLENKILMTKCLFLVFHKMSSTFRKACNVCSETESNFLFLYL